MKIIKRNFRTEDFDINKIITSIENTAKDCNYSLNSSDVNYLKRETEKIVEEFIRNTNERTISSFEVKMILFNTLKECNFKRIASVYINT